jgi:transposase
MMWDGERKRSVQRRYLGKKLIVTDRHDWDDASIVLAYRRLTRTESLFKISKSDPGLWWPMFHWTDSKMRVHALYCFFALLLLAILRLNLRQADVTMRVGRAVEQLAKIRESVVVYTNGATDRVLTEMDDVQEDLAQALRLKELAQELGTTVLAVE